MDKTQSPVYLCADDALIPKKCRLCMAPMEIKQINLTVAVRQCYKCSTPLQLLDCNDIQFFHRSYRDIDKSPSDWSPVVNSDEEELSQLQSWIHNLNVTVNKYDNFSDDDESNLVSDELNTSRMTIKSDDLDFDSFVSKLENCTTVVKPEVHNDWMDCGELDELDAVLKKVSSEQSENLNQLPFSPHDLLFSLAQLTPTPSTESTKKSIGNALNSVLVNNISEPSVNVRSDISKDVASPESHSSLIMIDEREPELETSGKLQDEQVHDRLSLLCFDDSNKNTECKEQEPDLSKKKSHRVSDVPPLIDSELSITPETTATVSEDCDTVGDEENIQFISKDFEGEGNTHYISSDSEGEGTVYYVSSDSEGEGRVQYVPANSEDEIEESCESNDSYLVSDNFPNDSKFFTYSGAVNCASQSGTRMLIYDDSPFQICCKESVSEQEDGNDVFKAIISTASTNSTVLPLYSYQPRSFYFVCDCKDEHLQLPFPLDSQSLDVKLPDLSLSCLKGKIVEEDFEEEIYVIPSDLDRVIFSDSNLPTEINSHCGLQETYSVTEKESLDVQCNDVLEESTTLDFAKLSVSTPDTDFTNSSILVTIPADIDISSEMLQDVCLDEMPIVIEDSNGVPFPLYSENVLVDSAVGKEKPDDANELNTKEGIHIFSGSNCLVEQGDADEFESVQCKPVVELQYFRAESTSNVPQPKERTPIFLQDPNGTLSNVSLENMLNNSEVSKGMPHDSSELLTFDSGNAFSGFSFQVERSDTNEYQLVQCVAGQELQIPKGESPVCTSYEFNPGDNSISDECETQSLDQLSCRGSQISFKTMSSLDSELSEVMNKTSNILVDQPLLLKGALLGEDDDELKAFTGAKFKPIPHRKLPLLEGKIDEGPRFLNLLKAVQREVATARDDTKKKNVKKVKEQPSDVQD